MRTKFTILVILALVLTAFAISVREARAGDLSKLRQVGTFRIGPSDLREMPPQWLNRDTKERCKCHEACNLLVPQFEVLQVFTADPPRNQCGVQVYFLANRPRATLLPLHLNAMTEFQKSERDIIREYGPPTYRTTHDSTQLAYCTSLSGRVLSLKEAKVAGEMFEYGFGFDSLNGKMLGVTVRWTDVCYTPPFPTVR